MDLIADVFDEQGKEPADNLRDAWHERMAICTIDGHQTTPQAEAIAYKEISQASAPP